MSSIFSFLTGDTAHIIFSRICVSEANDRRKSRGLAENSEAGAYSHSLQNPIPRISGLIPGYKTLL